MAGDGQVSLGDTVIKHAARKVRRIGKDESILAGLRGPLRTRSRCLRNSAKCWKSIPVT